MIYIPAALFLAVLIVIALRRTDSREAPDIRYTDEYDPPITDRVDIRAFFATYQD